MGALDLFRLDGAVALVTGGSTGIGLQMATALAEAGARVVIASRNLERCHEIVDELRAAGAASPLALQLDLSARGTAEALVAQVVAACGRLDVLINNSAATDIHRPFEPFTIERFEAVVRVNLTGLMECAYAALGPMKQQQRGKIINVGSVYGLLGVDGSLYGAGADRPMHNYPYTASKGAVLNLTRELAVNWARHGINVNAISPGMFPVEMQKRKYPQGTFDRIQERIPMGRLGNSTDLQGATIFLASAASDYVTGHNLVVDGGWVAW